MNVRKWTRNGKDSNNMDHYIPLFGVDYLIGTEGIINSLFLCLFMLVTASGCWQ